MVFAFVTRRLRGVELGVTPSFGGESEADANS